MDASTLLDIDGHRASDTKSMNVRGVHNGRKGCNSVRRGYVAEAVETHSREGGGPAKFTIRLVRRLRPVCGSQDVGLMAVRTRTVIPLLRQPKACD